MTIDQVPDLVRVEYGFVLSEGSGTVESAEPSVWFLSTTNPTTDSDWNALLLELAGAAYESWHADVATEHWETSVVLASCKATHQSTSGHVLHEQVYIPGGGGTWHGTSSAGSLPWQTSLCVSTYTYTRGTFIPNRRSRSGRFYTPPMSVSVLSDADSGMVSAEFAADRAGEIAQSWTDVMSASYTSFGAYHPVLGVNSRKQVAFYPVNEISVDTKLDTQRRRTKSLIPVIGVLPFPVT